MSTRRFVSEAEALKFLEVAGFIVERGIIRSPKGRDESDLSPMQADAIAYLCDEWDYDSMI